MSRKERDRLKVIEQVQRGRMSQVKAAEVLRLSVRQVRRLEARYRREGDGGLAHRSRDRSSIRRIEDATNHVFQRFFPSDTTVANMAMIGDYIARRGSLGRATPSLPIPGQET